MASPARSFPEERTCPFNPGYEWTRSQPLSRVQIADGSIVWLATGHGEVQTVLNDSRFSADASRPGFPVISPNRMNQLFQGTFIRMDGQEHTRRRSPLAGEFTARRMAVLRPWIERIVTETLDEILSRTPPVDFVEAFARPIPVRVICQLLGLPYPDHAFFQNQVWTIFDHRNTPDQASAADKELRSYLGEVLDNKRNNPDESLLSRLAQDDSDAGREEAVNTAWLLVVAGFDTTASMLALSILTLLRNPTELERLRADATLMSGAVEELLRYLTVVQFGVSRVALVDVQLGARLIRAGEGIVALLPTANRDSTRFSDADRFDVARKPGGHVAFGFGPHLCLGSALARLELNVVFSTLFERIPTLRLAVPANELSYRSHMFVYGVRELPLTWDRP